ncbi:GRAM-domain-containing protein [Rickenella mellea]|uniref:GRAM-domain-containing protein n=1 Tax=Rickenella mellea TaxID=50990 RepID=A0A4Y7Q232_9AGAM|nr:GRAM-domain-containing protein [Rickenella mellea]
MQPPPQLSSPPRPKPKTQRTASSGSGPNRTRSRHETASGGHVHHHHTASNGSPNGDDNGNDEYSDMSSGSESELDLDDDIPVTGFAVASSKRNADFHELFPSVPEGDYLIEDYGCALQREILIQGRIYISENHICFHANIFGWITDLTIPVYEITGLEKKMTAFVIPNAIQICTRATKYTFASFLSRDTTFDVMHNIWRLARPDASAEGDTNSMLSRSPRGSLDSGRGTPARSAMDVAVNGNLNNGMALDLGGGGSIESGGGGVVTGKRRKATLCACGRNKQHYSETPMEVILPGSPEKIYNLMFASGFIKDFMREDQKLMDVQISDWYREGESGLLSRNFSYIKPLGGGLGPKQTKCELKDETVHCDFDDYVSTVTTTRTPDVPSGSVFAVKTRTCIMWASAATTRVVVTSQVEWSGRSFIKSIIEKSALDGQKTYHADLERAMRSYINEHRTEFIPDGVDVADAEPLAEAIVESPLPVTPGTAVPLTPGSADAEKQREHERNQRGLQWAWDTLMGAWKVAKQSTTGALDLISDAWDQSSSTTILIFVIVVLVLSNLWTLMMVGKREEIGRRKELRKVAERERWVQGVVAALWEEMAAGRGPHPQVQSDGALIPKVSSDWRDEVGEINLALDAVEERVKRIRKGLQELD